MDIKILRKDSIDAISSYGKFMKKDNFIFISSIIIIISVSMIISSVILAKAISEQKQLYGALNTTVTGSLSTADLSVHENDKGDIIQLYDAASMLGYNDQNQLAEDIEKGQLKGIPCTKIRNHYVFSRRALEEWLYDKAKNTY